MGSLELNLLEVTRARSLLNLAIYADQEKIGALLDPLDTITDYFKHFAHG